MIVCVLAGSCFAMLFLEPAMGVGEPVLEVTAIVNDRTVTLTGTCMPGLPWTRIDHIRFDWGDRTTQDGWMPVSHTYAEDGRYQIIVTAFQTNGMESTRSLMVEIGAPWIVRITLLISPFVAVFALILVGILAIRKRQPRPRVVPVPVQMETSRTVARTSTTGKVTLDEIFTTDEPGLVSGYLEPIGGSDAGRTPYVIKSLNVKIGRGPYGKDRSTQNDLQLSDDDATQSRDQARLRVDPETQVVSIMHDSTTSRTTVSGQMLPFRKETKLRDNDEIEFGTRGATWRFRRAKQSSRPTIE